MNKISQIQKLKQEKKFFSNKKEENRFSSNHQEAI
jgi:hypothetical protein